MLKLICGPSGSGKTAHVTDAIRQDVNAGIRCFLIVPEQQAYISERDLTAALPPCAGRYLEIVNFSSLAEDVFREYGGVTQPSAGTGTRSLLMWETLRRLSPLLLQYGKSARTDTALTAKMLSAVEEFQNNGIDSDRLEHAAKCLPDGSPLQKKLNDLALIDASFRETARASFGASVPDRLMHMAELLESHSYFAGCRIYLDSFTSFTVPEYTVLRALLRQADTVTVALCTDGLTSRMLHFECVTRTAQRLLRMAQTVGTETERLNLPPAAGKKPAELRILERELWNFTLTKAQRELSPAGESVAVHLTVCPNLYEEAEACAIRILGLVQEGMHYGDIAVVVRETETYRGVLDAAMERHGIPYFLSERTDLSSKPLSRLILSALRAVSRGYQVQDILTLLKTGLSGADLRDVALFEEYCETWHITGSRFTDTAWSMNPDGLTERHTERGEEILAAANRVRQTVMDPLLSLAAELRASSRLADRCCAVYGYLCRLNISQALSEQAKHELALGQRREAGESVRLYQFAVETLTGLCALLPECELSTDEFLSALSLLFSETDLGSVPNVHDCVVIGSAAMLRVENVRASFLLGLCEGEFPKADSDDGILTEADKDTLADLGISFDSRQNLRSSEELFFVYRAMTKPTEQLFLSYPSMQTDGSARTPSLAFSRACFLFDRKPEVFYSGLIQHNITESARETELSALPFPERTALQLSQSSVQTFVLCPYRYYSTYQLGLRARKDSTVSAADEGTFLHYVFEQLLRASLNADNRLCLPAPDELPAVADRIIASYLSHVCPIPPDEMDSRLLHLFERLRGLAILMLNDISGEIAASRFRPARFEQVLGGNSENALPPVLLTLQNGSTVELRGLVDRVDLFEHEDKLYVRIVDYKTGRHEFSLDDVKSGVDIQLVLYLFAVVSSDPEHLVPAGAQYLFSHQADGKTKISRSGFLLDDAEIRSAADVTETALYSCDLLRQSAEELKQLTQDMQAAVCSVAERILAGEARKTPSEKACRFCPVREHCDVAYRAKR